jgi:hypothetical protein
MSSINMAVLADMHTNSQAGVNNPDWLDSEGNGLKLSDPEEWLWECNQDLLQRFKANAQPGDINCCVHVGDASDSAWKHSTTRLHTYDDDEAKELGVATLRPWREAVDHMWMVQGTEAHGGRGGAVERAIAGMLDVERHPRTRNPLWQRLRLSFDDFRLDFAHHTSVSGNPWGLLNSASGHIIKIQTWYNHHHLLWPHLAFRAHVHLHVDTYNNFPIRLIVLPGFQLETLHSARQPDRVADIGGVLFRLEAGRLAQLETVLYQPEDDNAWTLQPPAPSSSIYEQ